VNENKPAIDVRFSSLFHNQPRGRGGGERMEMVSGYWKSGMVELGIKKRRKRA
jgi:hypothetical protein